MCVVASWVTEAYGTHGTGPGGPNSSPLCGAGEWEVLEKFSVWVKGAAFHVLFSSPLPWDQPVQSYSQY